MCITIEQACGFVLLNEFNRFVYCCKSCPGEFVLAPDFEEHILSEHEDDKDDINLNPNIFVDCLSATMEIGAEDIKTEPFEGNDNEDQLGDSILYHVDANDISASKDVNLDHSSTHDPSPESSTTKFDDKINSNETTVKRKCGRPVGWRKENHEFYQCDMCPGETFVRKESLKTHMRCCHIRKRCYLCNIIPKNYDQHMRKTHMNEKPHKCDHCEKTFKHSHQKIDHMRLHTGEKPFLCGICGKSFRRTMDLCGHKKVAHTREKKNKCTECEQAFFTPFKLREHIVRCHTNERPELCNICGKSFTTKDNLRIHKRSHGERTIPCRLCDTKFKTYGSRGKHERNVHKTIKRNH